MVDTAVLVSATAAVAALALALEGGYSHWTVPAFGPWAVAGGALQAAGRSGVYDSLPAPASTDHLLVVLAGAAAATWVVAGWAGASQGVSARERYLAAAGSGVAVTLLLAMLTHLDVPPARLVWLVAVPMAAAVVGTVGFLAFGFLVVDLFTDLRIAGLYTVGTVVFEAAASVAAREVLSADAEGILVDALVAWYAAADVDPAWWAVLAGQLAVALGVVLGCARLSRWRKDVGRAAVLVVSVVALWSGTDVLLSATAHG